MRWAGSVAGVLIVSAGFGHALAATVGAAIEVSPDTRPVLVLTPPQGELQLVRRATRRRARLPALWRTSEPDRGFTQALLMQLSHVAANWPWRSLIVSSSGAESDRQLQALAGQDAVVAVAQDELVDLAGKVEFHLIMELTTLRAIATPHETRVRTHVEYIAPALVADSAAPRRNPAPFAMDGALTSRPALQPRISASFWQRLWRASRYPAACNRTIPPCEAWVCIRSALNAAPRTGWSICSPDGYGSGWASRPAASWRCL